MLDLKIILSLNSIKVMSDSEIVNNIEDVGTLIGDLPNVPNRKIQILKKNAALLKKEAVFRMSFTKNLRHQNENTR